MIPAMVQLPVRGPEVRSLGLALPPARMPLLRGTRPLKRWRWVGVFGPDLMVCVGDARVAGVPRRWWAVALPDGALHGRATQGRGGVLSRPGLVSVDARDARIEIALEEDASGCDPVEVVSPAGSAYVWTRKLAGVPVSGFVSVGGRRFGLEGALGFVDESAGYHPRRTTWRWSAGVGRSVDGRAVGWNLVAGVHDAPSASERTVWVDGDAREVGPVQFATDLSRVDGLRFREWSVREDHVNRLVVRNDYVQPFGEFSGTLPGGIELEAGWGVMEWHDVRW
jgi:uncharacterized protein DUF2804